MYGERTFEDLSDWELLAEIKKLKSNQCQVPAEVVRYLAEVDRREVYTLLRERKVSLCSLSQVAKVITQENKGELLELVQGLPKQESERLAARYSAPVKEKRGRKTQLRSCRSLVGVQPSPEACPDEALWTNRIPPASNGRSLESRKRRGLDSLAFHHIQSFLAHRHS